MPSCRDGADIWDCSDCRIRGGDDSGVTGESTPAGTASTIGQEGGLFGLGASLAVIRHMGWHDDEDSRRDTSRGSSAGGSSCYASVVGYGSMGSSRPGSSIHGDHGSLAGSSLLTPASEVSEIGAPRPMSEAFSRRVPWFAFSDGPAEDLVDPNIDLEQLLQMLLLQQGLLEDQETGVEATTLRELRRTGGLAELSEEAQTTLLCGTLYEYSDAASVVDPADLGSPLQSRVCSRLPSRSCRRPSVGIAGGVGGASSSLCGFSVGGVSGSALSASTIAGNAARAAAAAAASSAERRICDHAAAVRGGGDFDLRCESPGSPSGTSWWAGGAFAAGSYSGGADSSLGRASEGGRSAVTTPQDLTFEGRPTSGAFTSLLRGLALARDQRSILGSRGQDDTLLDTTRRRHQSSRRLRRRGTASRHRCSHGGRQPSTTSPRSQRRPPPGSGHRPAVRLLGGAAPPSVPSSASRPPPPPPGAAPSRRRPTQGLRSRSSPLPRTTR